jgi:hypothetical protein
MRELSAAHNALFTTGQRDRLCAPSAAMSDSELAVVSVGSFAAPILIGRVGPSTRIKFVDFFTVPIRNVECLG